MKKMMETESGKETSISDEKKKEIIERAKRASTSQSFKTDILSSDLVPKGTQIIPDFRGKQRYVKIVCGRSTFRLDCCLV